MREDKLIKDNSYIGKSTIMSIKQNNMLKETILKEFDNEFTNSPINFSFIREEVRQSFSKAIDQTKKETREETIMEIEELIDNECIIRDIYKNSDDLLNDIKKELNKLKK